MFSGRGTEAHTVPFVGDGEVGVTGEGRGGLRWGHSSHHTGHDTGFVPVSVSWGLLRTKGGNLSSFRSIENKVVLTQETTYFTRMSTQVEVSSLYLEIGLFW